MAKVKSYLAATQAVVTPVQILVVKTKNHLKGYQKYDRSKLKIQLSLSKFRFFNFDLSYFGYPLRYRVIQYLIGKISDIVKMSQEESVVAALQVSVRTS